MASAPAPFRLPAMNAVPRVLVLGGGFAGLETSFLLRMRAGRKVDIKLVSERDAFLSKPNPTSAPFGADPESFLIPLRRPTYKQHIDLVHGTVREVDPDRRM